jgi:hypothetical protein
VVHLSAPPDDADRFANMSVEERLQLFLELCDLTDSIVNARPNRDALRRPTPRSASSEAVWKRLMTGAPRAAR